jgi:hypothetical protein
MVMELTNVRENIKVRLDLIPQLKSRNYKQEPDTVPATPFTVLGKAEIDYDDDMGGGRTYRFRIFLAVREGSSENSFGELDDYLASAGEKSVKEILEKEIEDIDGPGDYCHLRRWENVGTVEYRGKIFVGAEAIIEIPSGG